MRTSAREPGGPGRPTTATGRGVLRGLFFVAVSSAVSVACAGDPPPPPVPIDAEGVAEQMTLSTRLQEPVRIIFDWSLNEAGSRTSGRGVVRMEPPYKARLDLFTGKGETVLRAALVDDALRLPPGGEGRELVPPPSLLWAALGVFRPGARAYLVTGTALQDDQVSLSYGYAGGEEARFRISGDVVQEAELLRGGQVVERVDLEREGESAFPAEAVYRNLGEFRELKLMLDSYESVEVFPPDIWLRGG